jgi:5-methylcytosine-specific restriction endonuclease McrA
MEWSCAQCGTAYRGRKRKYCSKQCSMMANSRRRGRRPIAVVLAERAEQKRLRTERVCQQCGKVFYRKPGGKAYRGESNEGRFCSYECMGHAQSEGKHSPVYCGYCEVCRQPFVRRGALKVKICGEECRTEYANHRYRTSNPLDESANCKGCGSAFKPEHGRQLFCERRCLRRYDRRQRRAQGKDPRKYRHRARKAGVAYEPVAALAVLERDGWRCQICGRKTPKRYRGKFVDNAPELDHRIPMALGGGHTWDNVQCACRKCNLDKAGHKALGQMRMEFVQ